MDFYQINEYIKSLPEIYHMLASGVLIGMLAHLIIAFRATYKLQRKRINIYWIISYSVMLTMFFLKYSTKEYKILDAFLPVYIIYYIHSILILKTRVFRCDISFKEFFKFNTVKH